MKVEISSAVTRASTGPITGDRRVIYTYETTNKRYSSQYLSIPSVTL